METKFREEDFTEKQLMILRLAFTLVGEVVETLVDSEGVYLPDELYTLKEKLGVFDLVR